MVLGAGRLGCGLTVAPLQDLPQWEAAPQQSPTALGSVLWQTTPPAALHWLLQQGQDHEHDWPLGTVLCPSRISDSVNKTASRARAEGKPIVFQRYATLCPSQSPGKKAIHRTRWVY